MLKTVGTAAAALLIAAGLGAFPLWLDAPQRANQFDPKAGIVLPTAVPVDTSTITPTITPTFSITPTPSNSPAFTATSTPSITATPTDTPYFSPTFTPTPSETFTESPTFSESPTFTETPNAPTPTYTPYIPCFTPPGAPLLMQPLFEGTGTWQLGPAGGSAQWCNPAPSTLTQDTIDPHSGGFAHLIWTLSWASGWWAGGGYNWASWWDPAKQFDKANYDTLEFWIRGEVGGESVIRGVIACNSTPSNGMEFPITDRYIGPSLTTSWQQVIIPLCDIDFGTADPSKMWEIDLSTVASESGAATFYVADMYLVKY